MIGRGVAYRAIGFCVRQKARRTTDLNSDRGDKHDFFPVFSKEEAEKTSQKKSNRHVPP